MEKICSLSSTLTAQRLEQRSLLERAQDLAIANRVLADMGLHRHSNISVIRLDARTLRAAFTVQLASERAPRFHEIEITHDHGLQPWLRASVRDLALA